MSGAPALELRDVHASYGPFRALFGIDLTVPAGGAVALVGANGVGKTTVARVATGLLRPTSGSVWVAGRDLTGVRTHQFARAGVFHAPEGRSVFATLTVEENLRLTRHRGTELREAIAEAFDLFPRLAERRSQVAGTLSGGEQRMLALAAAIVERPSLLVADEVSLGLAPMIVDEVYRRMAEIRASGTALLVVEQQVTHALDLCDQVVLLSHGTVDWSGPADDAGEVVERLFSLSGSPHHRADGGA